LNSGLCNCKAGSLSIELHLKFKTNLRNINNVLKLSVLLVAFNLMKEVLEKTLMNVKNVIKPSEITVPFNDMKELIVKTSMNINSR
jgi:hypothetical protein